MKVLGADRPAPAERGPVEIPLAEVERRHILRVLDHVDHLKALGVTYVHFMPCLRPREGANDGGYAVSSYREVDPALGTMAELSELATDLRHRGRWGSLEEAGPPG